MKLDCPKCRYLNLNYVAFKQMCTNKQPIGYTNNVDCIYHARASISWLDEGNMDTRVVNNIEKRLILYS